MNATSWGWRAPSSRAACARTASQPSLRSGQRRSPVTATVWARAAIRSAAAAGIGPMAAWLR